MPLYGKRVACQSKATDAVALQSWVVELIAVRPILPTFHQTGAHRVFFDIEPFVVKRFIGAKQTIKRTRLPFPRGV